MHGATEFPLPVGHVLPEGKVVGVTLTAYKVVPKGACQVCGTPGENCPPLMHGLLEGVVFVPFVKVHPPVAATPLVVLG